MLTHEQQETLTRVGRGTPMGELLRRYWHPVAATSELAAGRAMPVRLLGDDLALFRTAGGALGLVDGRCPHRGASLAWGSVDDGSLRCAYHGWRFAPDGACLELPSLSGDPALCERARIRGHGSRSWAASCGPTSGPSPRRWCLATTSSSGLARFATSARRSCRATGSRSWRTASTRCTWNGSMGTDHLAAVRRRLGLPTPARYGRRHVEIGFDTFPHGIIKRRVLEGRSRDDDDWRIGHALVFPLMLRVGAGRQHRLQIRVPVDDTHTRHYWYSCYLAGDGAPAPVQEEIPVYEVPFQDERGQFLLDFVDGGDIMTWVTQGPIADRTREMLVDTDRGIPVLRRLYFEQIERIQAGGDPLGIVRDPRDNVLIELPQERDKYGAGDACLAESVAMSHVRYSPIRGQILDLLGFTDAR